MRRSVAAGDPKIFADYAVWTSGLLSHFGIAADQLAALFGAMGRAVVGLVRSAKSLIRPHLEAGERAITH